MGDFPSYWTPARFNKTTFELRKIAGCYEHEKPFTLLSLNRLDTPINFTLVESISVNSTSKSGPRN